MAIVGSRPGTEGTACYAGLCEMSLQATAVASGCYTKVYADSLDGPSAPLTPLPESPLVV
jgi:hypothetical protein